MLTFGPPPVRESRSLAVARPAEHRAESTPALKGVQHDSGEVRALLLPGRKDAGENLGHLGATLCLVSSRNLTAENQGPQLPLGQVVCSVHPFLEEECEQIGLMLAHPLGNLEVLSVGDVACQEFADSVYSGLRGNCDRLRVEYALYAKYGPGRAAKPGTSNHEKGVAIDFKNTPGAWDWLKKNAQRFGLKNLPSELY